MLPVALVLAGFLVGMILTPAVMRWAVLVHTSLAKQSGDYLGPPRRRLLWFAPFVIVFNPAPYLLAALGFVTFLAFAGRLSAGWPWLLGGFYAYAVLLGILVVPRMLKLRSKTRDTRKA